MRILFLAPLSWLYQMAVALRHRLFDLGILKSTEYDIPIVCVGNITVGGTGKTPVSEYLIKQLSHRYNVALLSRGYKRKTHGFVEVMADSTYRNVGDEPKQIKLKFPNIIVAVCGDRRKGIEEIRKSHPKVNMIILDDGFQHRYVEAWVNIILMDYTRPIYRDHMLPRGTLRDSIKQLHRAHFVLVTKCPQNLTPLDKRIVSKYLGLYPYQSLYFTRMVCVDPMPLFEETPELEFKKATNVIAMAGIGNPNPFVEYLDQKYNKVGELIYKDHHAYRMRDLEKMKKALEAAPEGTILITTEKDAVKLTNRKRIPEQIRKRLYFIPINVSFADDTQEEFLRKLEYNVRTNPKNSLLHSQ